MRSTVGTVTDASPDLHARCFSSLAYSAVFYYLLYVIHLNNTYLLLEITVAYSLRSTLCWEADFSHILTRLCSFPLLLSECFKEQVSTAPWGPVIESSEGRTDCQSPIKNATENTYIIQIIF